MKIHIPHLKYYFISAIFIISGCKKLEIDREIVFSAREAQSITPTSAQLTSELQDLGPGISQHGHCWSRNISPTTEDFSSKLGEKKSPGEFVSTPEQLLPATKYYFRAYCISNNKIIYSEEKTFTTSSPEQAILNNLRVNNILSDGARAAAEVTSLGVGNDTLYHYGHCWSLEALPTLEDSLSRFTNMTSPNIFATEIQNLLPGQTYYIRAYGINRAGIVYSDQVSFTTDIDIPDLTTFVSAELNHNSVICGGSIKSNGGSIISEQGICWSKTPLPSLNDNILPVAKGETDFSILLDNLQASTTYYLRAYARNKAGTAYGNEIAITTTAAVVPRLTTALITKTDKIFDALEVSALISDEGGEPVLKRGFCWNQSGEPTIQEDTLEAISDNVDFTGIIENLKCDSIYHVRAFALNSAGVGYGNTMVVQTNRLEDYSGNEYKWVKVGNQVWMSENLRSNHYSDGEAITEGNELTDIYLDKTPVCFFNYNYDPTYADSNGFYYTWAAAMNGTDTSSANPSGIQGVCPTGWHIPSKAEWVELGNYLGGMLTAGSNIKTAGTVHWNPPNSGADNASGLSVKGTGERSYRGDFEGYRGAAMIWSSEIAGDDGQYLHSNVALFDTYNSWLDYIARPANNACSVRCVKN